jgi:hypothetical protein
MKLPEDERETVGVSSVIDKKVLFLFCFLLQGGVLNQHFVHQQCIQVACGRTVKKV